MSVTALLRQHAVSSLGHYETSLLCRSWRGGCNLIQSKDSERGIQQRAIALRTVVEIRKNERDATKASWDRVVGGSSPLCVFFLSKVSGGLCIVVILQRLHRLPTLLFQLEKFAKSCWRPKKICHYSIPPAKVKHPTHATSMNILEKCPSFCH